MTFILILIVSVVMGYATHFINAIIKRISTVGWRSITLYILRATIRIPSIMMVAGDLKDDIQDARKLVLVSYIVSSCAFGVGVLLGWLFNE